MKNPYTTLGVAQTASRDDVKRAYRKRAKKAHPDRVGGNHEEMAELNRAYALLEDPEKRARYDSGEDPDRPKQTLEQEAEAMLLGAMDAVYNTHKATDNLAEALRKTLTAAKAGQTQELVKAERAAKKAARVLKCLKGGERFRPYLEERAAQAQRNEATVKRCLEVLEVALTYAAEVGWDDPEAAQQTQNPFFATYRTTT